MQKNLFAISELLLSVAPMGRSGVLNRHIIPMRSVGREYDGLVLILEGQCHYTMEDGRKFTARKDDVLYLADGARYAMDIDCDSYSFFVVDFLLADETPRKSSVYTPRDKERARHLFSRLCSKSPVISPGIKAEEISTFYRILALLWESTQSNYVAGKSRVLMEAAASSIHARYRDPSLSVSELSLAAHMSEVHFRRLFARCFGISPARYIMKERVDRAIERMMDGKLSLSDVAEQCGFSSLSYFHRVFKDIMGTTPAVYRRELLSRPL